MRRFALVLAFLPAALPAYAGTPLFDKFKTFCIDTGADPAAVKRAAEAAGGVPAVPAATVPVPVTLQAWHLGDMNVSVSAPTKPLKGNTFCSMTSFVPDKQGLARLRAWAGVPPVADSFTFQIVGGKHLPVPNEHDPSYRVAWTSGRIWMLTVHDFGDGTMAALLHYLPP